MKKAPSSSANVNLLDYTRLASYCVRWRNNNYIKTSFPSSNFHTCTGLESLRLSFRLPKYISPLRLGYSSGVIESLRLSSNIDFLEIFSSGLFILRVLTNSVTFCHWISQNGNFWFSLVSVSVLLTSSTSFGLSALLFPPWPLKSRQVCELRATEADAVPVLTQ